jgi:outer membrane protein, heavy metal efflux system
MSGYLIAAIKKPIIYRCFKSGRKKLVILLLLLLNPINSATAESAKLDWQGAARLTLEKNPSLVAFGYELAAQRGRITQAGLKPNPELALVIEDATGTGDFQSLDNSETTLSIGWILEGSQRQARINTAQAANAKLIAERDVKRLDALANTARWYAKAMALQAMATQADDAVKIANDTLRYVERRIAAGKSPHVELARAKVELAQRKLAREDISHEQAITYKQLAAHWGESDVGFTQVTADIRMIPAILSYDELEKRIKQHPRYEVLLTHERWQESQIALARSQSKPVWRLSLGIKHLAATDDQALVAGVSVPLGVFDRQQGRITEARALAALSRAEREAELINLSAAVFSLHQELNHSIHKLKTYSDDIIPALEKALKETQTAYETSGYSYQEWVAVQRELINAQDEHLNTALAAHLQSIEIERLTGVSINAVNTHSSTIIEQGADDANEHH